MGFKSSASHSVTAPKNLLWGGGTLIVTLLFAVMLLCVPQTAWANIYLDGQEQGRGDIEINNSTGSHTLSGEGTTGILGRNSIIIDGGSPTITLSNLSISETRNLSSAIEITGGAQVTLKLEGTNTIHGESGHPTIWVEPGSSLTIDSDTNGTLTVYAYGNAAAIGGGTGTNSNFGDITINGGNVIAYGSGGGAGIGGGYESGTGSVDGNITINGGWVKAFGGEGVAGVSGAGIGSGENAHYEGTITINGGVVYAQGGDGSSSIGGGHRAIGDSGHGTFSTGTNGNAVICAPQGIGNPENNASWDAIFVSYEGTENSATLGADGGVTFDTTANVQVWGDPVADYNITVNSGTTLHIVEATETNNPASLTMQDNVTLTNNGRIVLGSNYNDTSTLVLWGGKEKTAGNGALNVDLNAAVKVPLTEALVSLSKTEFTYNGATQAPTVSVVLDDLWGYDQEFETPADYTLTMPSPSIEVGDYTVAVTSTGTGNLLGTDKVEKTYSIVKADFTVSVQSPWNVKQGETALLSKLPTIGKGAAVSAPGIQNDDLADLKAGTFTWYLDADHQQPVTDTSLENAELGSTTLYWEYAHNDGNFVSPKSGQIEVIITEFTPVDVDFASNYIEVTYGDAAQTLTPSFTLEGTPLTPDASQLTWESKNQDVVKVDHNGEVTFVGAGWAEVTVTIAENNSYSPPYAQSTGSIWVHVLPKEVKVVNVQTTDRQYDGTTEVEVTADLDGVINNDDVQLNISGELRTPDVRENKTVDLTCELTGADKDNYKLVEAPATATVTISKADTDLGGKEIVQVIYNDTQRTYYVRLANLTPENAPEGFLNGQAFSLGTDAVEILKTGYFEASDISVVGGSYLQIPVNKVKTTEEATVANITVTISSRNFNDITGTVVVKTDTPVKHVITAEAGEGGTIDPSGEVEVIEGENQTFNFVPDEGYEIDQVLVNGSPVEITGTSYTFENVTEAQLIYVSFKAIPGQGGSTGEEGTTGEGGSGEDAGEGTLTKTGDNTPVALLLGALSASALAAAAGYGFSRKLNEQ